MDIAEKWQKKCDELRKENEAYKIRYENTTKEMIELRKENEALVELMRGECAYCQHGFICPSDGMVICKIDEFDCKYDNFNKTHRCNDCKCSNCSIEWIDRWEVKKIKEEKVCECGKRAEISKHFNYKECANCGLPIKEASR